jgi:hypothetical protein
MDIILPSGQVYQAQIACAQVKQDIQHECGPSTTLVSMTRTEAGITLPECGLRTIDPRHDCVGRHLLEWDVVIGLIVSYNDSLS